LLQLTEECSPNRLIIILENIKCNRDFVLNFKREDFSLGGEDFVFIASGTIEGEKEIISDVYNKIKFGFDRFKFFLATDVLQE
jgi:hypothetical protein